MLTFDQQVPVTMVVTRTVRAGMEQRFEDWLHVISAEAMKFEGHLGVHVIRPSKGSREYTTVFRFGTPAQLKAWIDSEVRARLLQQAEALVEGNPDVQRLTGLEAWFSIPEKPATSPPPRHKVAIVTFAAVFPLLLVIPRLAAAFLQPFPEIARLGVVAATMILLMTYLVMPALTRLLHPWLYSAPPTGRR